MDESEWRAVAVLHGLDDEITNHPRFLRSLIWGDSDHKGHVLALIRKLFDRRPDVFMDLVARPAVQDWLMKNNPELLKLWNESSDPMLTALVHSIEDVEAAQIDIDLSQYTTRLTAALPNDPYLVIGVTKDMLEATMRTILHRHGVDKAEKLDFPALISRTLNVLGLQNASAPETQSERLLRKIVSTAKRMLETANDLRNEVGTGHGRVVGDEQEITHADASLVASCGLILAAWLLRHHQNP